MDTILIDLATIIGGIDGPGGPAGPDVCADGPLVCIKVGGCGTCGTCDGTCDTCGEVLPCCCPIDSCPDCPTEPPGEIIPDPDPLCLIRGGGLGFENGILIELWFSAKTKSCSKDYYLGSPSINWLGPNECGLEGFHGEASGGNLPGEVEVS